MEMEVRENRYSAFDESPCIDRNDRSRAWNLNKSISDCRALIRSRKWQKERADALAVFKAKVALAAIAGDSAAPRWLEEENNPLSINVTQDIY